AVADGAVYSPKPAYALCARLRRAAPPSLQYRAIRAPGPSSGAPLAAARPSRPPGRGDHAAASLGLEHAKPHVVPRRGCLRVGGTGLLLFVRQISTIMVVSGAAATENSEPIGPWEGVFGPCRSSPPGGPRWV